MDSESIGEKMCGELVEAGYIKSVADFYSLTRDQLLELEGVKEKSADNMLRAIEASKQRPLSRLLFGLNIRYAGGKSAQNIAQSFGSMDTVRDSSERESVSVPGIGSVSGQ